MVEKRTRDPEATKQAILEAAEEVFLEKGFGDTPMSLVAKKAGVTKSLIHHHFESKENLWMAVKHNALCGYAEKQTEIQNRGEVTPETLRETMEAYFRFLKENPGVVRFMAWMTLEEINGCEGMCVHDAVIEGAIAQIETAQKKGFVRNDIPAFRVVMTFLTMVHGWFQDRYMFRKWLVEGDSPQDMDNADKIFLETAISFIASGIRAAK